MTSLKVAAAGILVGIWFMLVALSDAPFLLQFFRHWHLALFQGNWTSWMRSSITSSERREAVLFYSRVGASGLFWGLCLQVPLILLTFKGVGALIKKREGASLLMAMITVLVGSVIHMAWQLNVLAKLPLLAALVEGGVIKRAWITVKPLASRSMDEQFAGLLFLALGNMVMGMTAVQIILDALASGESTGRLTSSSTNRSEVAHASSSTPAVNTDSKATGPTAVDASA